MNEFEEKRDKTKAFKVSQESVNAINDIIKKSGKNDIEFQLLFACEKEKHKAEMALLKTFQKEKERCGLKLGKKQSCPFVNFI